jgi:sulfur-oxidizing protein SoxB
MFYTIHKKELSKFLTSMTAAAALAFAATDMANAADVTIIQVSDLHGNLVPHAGIIEEYNPATGGVTERAITNGGGIAKVATVIKDIRASSNEYLTLGVGDSIHGSAEVLYTMGDAIMPAFNALGLDAYTPGNWEFAYGPAVFRNRFSDFCKARPKWQFPGADNNPGPGTPGVLCPVIPANARMMTDSDGTPGITAANFKTLAANLYNGGPYPTAAPFFGKRTNLLDPYAIFERDGVQIAVIGITAAIIPQQPPVFGRTFRFTQGTEELPGLIKEIKDQGVEIIVVQSELGLPQNVQIGREFPDIDIILSAHSHELTVGAIIADADGFEGTVPGQPLSGNQLARVQKGAAIVVEAGEDLYVGRLDLKISGNKVQNFVWNAIPVDDSIPEDLEVAKLVAEQEKFFIGKGEPDSAFKTHAFLPFSACMPYAPGKFDPIERCGGVVDAYGVIKRGVRLVDSLDEVVGATDALLHRHDALEGVMNNFIADAFNDTLASIANTRDIWAESSVISMTNGFRFDTVVLPPNNLMPEDVQPTPPGSEYRDGRVQGEVTLRDIYSYFPVPPALVAADYAGIAIEQNLDSILANVFHPNPYIQRGGWYLGLSANMSQKVDVVRLPGSSSGSRILETKIDGNVLDHSKRYVIASCYGHTSAIGRSCRLEGGANMVFYALADSDDYQSVITMEAPTSLDGLISNHPGQGGVGSYPAPDNFLHPIHALRLYLDKIGTITEAQFGEGRVQHVNANVIEAGTYKEEALPHSDIPGVVQPIEGIGPSWLERGVIVHTVE